MKTKVEAANILLNAGWTTLEVKSVLGSVPELSIFEQRPIASPWWLWVNEEWYTSRLPAETVWTDWMAPDK